MTVFVNSLSLFSNSSDVGEPIIFPNVSWYPPFSGSWKVNVDASLIKAFCSATLGVVVRDSHCVVFVWAMKAVHHVTSPLQAELLVILYGMELPNRFAFTSLVVERDSLLALKEVDREETTLCRWCGLVKNIEIQCQLCESFSSVFIKREANMFAHKLSKLPLVPREEHIWVN
ncbi:hypothetical protein DITRI_Ditri17bG0063000 [Diplodiscus trichospermus]